MKKKTEPITVAQLATLALGFFVFDKFGGVAAAKEILRTTKVLSAREVLPTAPEDWKVTPIDGVYNKQNPLPGYTFGGDYPPWYLWEPVRS